ncbi:MAG: hypothetical protein QW353_04320 [Candidatus Korarchaeum sp.]
MSFSKLGGAISRVDPGGTPDMLMPYLYWNTIICPIPQFSLSGPPGRLHRASEGTHPSEGL